MRILIAADSFKDALPAQDVCAAIGEGVLLAEPGFFVKQIPLADGGEGTAAVLTRHFNGEWLPVTVHDPLMRPVEAHFGYIPAQQRAFIDMAQASGLQLIAPEERNPRLTSSFGTGELLKKALEIGAKDIILGIGGSATNDGGMGMARALGWRFFDAQGRELAGIGDDLVRVAQIKPGIFPDCPITVLCDVENPLFGPDGAAHVYGAQKGASEAAIQSLDEGLQQFAARCAAQFGRDLAHLPGAGAAGGMGFGAMLFLNGQLKSGIGTVMELIGLEREIAAADVIITGEGKLDAQTLQGKLINGICQRAKKYKKPVIAVCGALDASPDNIRSLGLAAAFSIQTRPVELQQALLETKAGLRHIGFQLGRLLAVFSN